MSEPLPEQVLSVARADVAAFTPGRTPPFAVVQARRRRRDRRRGALAVGLTAVVVAGVALVPGHERAAPTASGDAPIGVSLDAPGAVAGKVVTVTAALRSPSGQAFVGTVDWGDGSPVHQALTAFSCPPRPPGPPPSYPAPGPSASSQRLQHVYRTPGRHTVTVTAVHAGCFAVPLGTGRATTTLDVGGDPQPGNGPVQPTAAIGLQGVRDGVLVGDGRAEDADGFVRSVVVEADGVRQGATGVGCADDGRSYRGSRLSVAFRRALPPGDHRLRVTVTSGDCRGGALQTTTVTRLVRVTATGWTDLEPPQYAPRPLPYTEDCCLEAPR